MPHKDAKTLVSTQWLDDHLSQPDIRVVDGSWYLPSENRAAYAEYQMAHIPGAVFFDIDDMSDQDSDLPHMLPPPEIFADQVGRLGLGDNNRIIVYDGAGLFSAARVWWMFQVMGHENVAVLDGGLPKWLAEGRTTDPKAPQVSPSRFTPRLNRSRIRDADDIIENLTSGPEQLVDARSPSRFAGEEPEPRKGVRPGHIPASRNLHYALLHKPDGTLYRGDELRTKFRDAGIDIDRPVITSCGSGVTAAILFLALTVLGSQKIFLYDGSWTEWGGRHDLPCEVGPPGSRSINDS